MIPFIILLFFLVIGLFLLILTIPPRQSAAYLVKAGPIFLMVVGGALTLLRRGVIGVPLMLLGLSWWRRNNAVRSATYSGGKKSTVRSANLKMELDHDTGEMDGMVLTGSKKGSRLSSLDQDEVLSLYREMYADTDSAALLESFLDRYHPDWRDHIDPDSFTGQDRTSGLDKMTKREAYQILGVEPDASPEEIHQAWRRLIKKVHPDSGGSAFLATKINTARDVLLH